jgi:hypothetical protein
MTAATSQLKGCHYTSYFIPADLVQVKNVTYSGQGVDDDILPVAQYGDQATLG